VYSEIDCTCGDLCMKLEVGRESMHVEKSVCRIERVDGWERSEAVKFVHVIVSIDVNMGIDGKLS